MDRYIKFSRNNWDKNMWQEIYSPRRQKKGRWKQLDDSIANIYPGDPDADTPECKVESDFASMLYTEPLAGSIRIETTCSYKERMAPLMVLSPELVPVYREHFEIVLYDCGINVWHHLFENGKPSWYLAGFHSFRTLPDTKYKLVTEIRRTPAGVVICVGVDEPAAGFRLPEAWQKPCFAGITACEGHNNFYDFRICGIDSTNGITERIH